MAAGLYSMRSAILRIETLRVALGHEQVAGGGEDGFADGVAFSVLSFSDAHRLQSN